MHGLTYREATIVRKPIDEYNTLKRRAATMGIHGLSIDVDVHSNLVYSVSVDGSHVSTSSIAVYANVINNLLARKSGRKI